MKRINNIFSKITAVLNVINADRKARKGKRKSYGVIKHDKDLKNNLKRIILSLRKKTYKVSLYKLFEIYEPKKRIIYKLPYDPDRIVHHAILNQTAEIWEKLFVKNTYACIPERGIHKLAKDLKHVLKTDIAGTLYCLKLDITKFYPSIDHEILKNIVRRKIKDVDLLLLLDDIIDSAPGVPIGNYTSLYLANVYLTYFDHWLMEEIKPKLNKRGVTFYFFRYADDITILSNDKEALHSVLVAIKIYLKYCLKLLVKDNYLIFPVDSRGIDFVGYVFYHTHTLLRKSIKTKINKLLEDFKLKKLTRELLLIKMSSYFGWLKYCDSKHFLTKIYNITGLKFSNWNGKNVGISRFYGKYIYLVNIVPHKKYYVLQFIYKGKPYESISKSFYLFLRLFYYPLPMTVQICY